MAAMRDAILRVITVCTGCVENRWEWGNVGKKKKNKFTSVVASEKPDWRT